MKSILIIAAVALVLFGLLSFRAREVMAGPRVDIVRGGATVTSFAVDIAVTSDQLTQGLMGREHLSEGTGMLFIFPRSGHMTMWMKNMVISLDFLFIDDNRTVVHMEHDIPPCPQDGPCPTIEAPMPVRYVLEIPSGTIARLGISVGDTMRLIYPEG